MEGQDYNAINVEVAPPQISVSAIPPPLPQQPYVVVAQPVYQPEAYIPPPIHAGNGVFIQHINYGPNGPQIEIQSPQPVHLQEIIREPKVNYNSKEVKNNTEEKKDECDCAGCFLSFLKITCYIICCLATLGLGIGISAQMR